MSAEGREGKTPPPPDDRATFMWKLDDVINNGLIEHTTISGLIAEFRLIESSPLGSEIDPSDELCWLSLAVGWFLGRGCVPDVAKAAALFVRYHVLGVDEHHHQDGE